MSIELLESTQNDLQSIFQQPFAITSFGVDSTKLLLSAGSCEFINGEVYRIENGDYEIIDETGDGTFYVHIQISSGTAFLSTNSGTINDDGEYYYGDDKVIFAVEKYNGVYRTIARMEEIITHSLVPSDLLKISTNTIINSNLITNNVYSDIRNAAVNAVPTWAKYRDIQYPYIGEIKYTIVVDCRLREFASQSGNFWAEVYINDIATGDSGTLMLSTQPSLGHQTITGSFTIIGSVSLEQDDNFQIYIKGDIPESGSDPNKIGTYIDACSIDLELDIFGCAEKVTVVQ